MGTSVSAVGTFDKAVRVLDALEAQPRSLTELTEATGLPRATAHRLATALEAHGLVRRADDGRFALGLRLVALGRAAADQLPLADAARPALATLRDQTGESVQLYVREGDRRVCVASLESPHGLRTIVAMGAALPLDRGSAGRVLTDAGTRSAADASTVSWVASVAERAPGVASVSAPVRAADGAVVAAVSVSGPLDRTGSDPGRRYGEDVAAAASAIEIATGLR